jgi:hypothetical protein
MVSVVMSVTCGFGWLGASRENALISERVAALRIAESENLNKRNDEQALTLDAEIAARTRLEEQVEASQLDLETAQLRNRELESAISIYQQALEVAGLRTDATEPAGRRDPAPRVEGTVGATKAAQRPGASDLVEISVGSDQGLKKRDEMTVHRSGLADGQRPKFLGRIVIVNIAPDKAVGEVVEGTRNGTIRRGDRVTTKL